MRLLFIKSIITNKCNLLCNKMRLIFIATRPVPKLLSPINKHTVLLHVIILRQFTGNLRKVRIYVEVLLKFIHESSSLIVPET